ncbi:MAG TPA: hypothetical protein VGJ89_12415 [Geothrix sp.]|jgi:uncharacterized membrane protein YadS
MNPSAPWFATPLLFLGTLLALEVATTVKLARALWIVPALHASGHLVAAAARRMLVLTLFLIGAGLSREALRSVGLRPFLQGLVLWLIVGSLGLGAVELGWLAVG